MEISLPNYQNNKKNLKVGIILPYFNDQLGLELLKNTETELLNQKICPKNIKIMRPAGSMEIPFTALKMTEKHKPDVIIALGVVLKGKTPHFDIVNSITHQGLMDVQLKTSIPIIFGILSCNNLKEARERISAKKMNKGRYFAIAAAIQANL